MNAQLYNNIQQLIILRNQSLNRDAEIGTRSPAIADTSEKARTTKKFLLSRVWIAPPPLLKFLGTPLGMRMF